MTILVAQDRYTVASGSRVKFGGLECEIHFKLGEELQVPFCNTQQMAVFDQHLPEESESSGVQEMDGEATAAPSAMEVDDDQV